MRILTGCVAFSLLMLSGLSRWSQAEVYTPPQTTRQAANFDIGWKFIKQDVPGAEATAFDDSKWDTITTPHTYNDVDTFNKWISHSSGQAGAYMGPAWYRKHFVLPENLKGKKIFLEFEGMKQAGQFYVNGKELGLFENGVTAYGLDITDAAKFGPEGNVISVRIDNSNDYKEKATQTGYQWMGKAFNPNYGGINRHVWLHVTEKVHQTLPLWEGLQTTGVYVYANNISVKDKTADINIEAQVQNGLTDNSVVTLNVAIVDFKGNVAAKFEGDTVDLVGGEKTLVKGTGKLSNAQFWSPDDPALYSVYTTLTIDGKVTDLVKTTTGFRKTDYRGGAGTGGVYINDKFYWLTGYAQRSSNEWAGLGQSYPDWMHDLSAKMLRESNGNYMRWMHITPQKVDVDAYDRAGIVQICPAGDKEKAVEGVQWDQRMKVMRASMIYFRNSPSILFWEAGNSGISAAQLKEMVDIRKELDPTGGRIMGCRTLNDPETTNIAEYFGVMVGQDRRTDALKDPKDQFRAFSLERRDRVPFLETEDFREEGARRFWDDYSPPHFGFKKGANDTYELNSETFALKAVARYNEYWSNRISNKESDRAKWSSYCSIYFSDSNADGRQNSSEVCRVSGKIDAVRLPKQIFFASRVMQNPNPDIHILGHWNYPADTKKPINIISNCDSVELFLDGKSIGKSDQPKNGFIFTFDNIAYTPGTLKAIGYKADKQAAEYSLVTSGPAKSVKLTPITGPGGFKADGADVVLYDVEVVDAQGRRCPTDEDRIDFTVTGPGVWRGGYNSGKIDTTNNLYLSTECGINRVAIRSTTTAGAIKLTAGRKGLESATVEVKSTAVKNAF